MYFHVSAPCDLVGSPELIIEESSSGISGNEKQTRPSDCWSQHESAQLLEREKVGREGGGGGGCSGRGSVRTSEQGCPRTEI